jgi:hypothetical protein
MARRAELVGLDLDDFTFLPDGTGRVLIRRPKTFKRVAAFVGINPKDIARGIDPLILQTWSKGGQPTRANLMYDLRGIRVTLTVS